MARCPCLLLYQASWWRCVYKVECISKLAVCCQIYCFKVVRGGTSCHMHHQADLKELNLHMVRVSLHGRALRRDFCTDAMIPLQLFGLTLSFSLI